MYYEDEGEGQPLLLLHGWGTSGRMWQAQLADLVRDHRVVTVDWRGCGRSDRPARGNTTSDVVTDLAEFVEAVGLRGAVVVGSSIGATFATELALRHPDRVGGVVAVDGPAYWPSEGMTDLVRSLRGDLVADRPGTLSGWVPKWFAPSTPSATIDWTIRQILDSGVYIDELLTESTGYDPRPSLPSLEVPIGYVHGRLDTEIPVEVAKDCASRTPGAELIVLDSGHLPQLEKPAEFTEALRALID